ncbi:glycine/D-amino acid oxidase-like deaminating enzyme [Bradyrhizobium sp. USDA 4509]|nr:glycine/D-amino acid oxidase-like deaminating enzyme [Bradyrhizobium elkanii]
MALPFGERLIELLGGAPQEVFELIERDVVDCEVERAGTLHCAVGHRGLQEIQIRAEQWQKRGAPVVVLNAEETRRKIGGGNYTGAMLDKRAGTIQPLAYARGLARLALAAGARIFTRTEILTVSDMGLCWRSARQWDPYVLSGWWVVVATDAYGNRPRSQVRLPYLNLATRPLSDRLRTSILPERQGAWDTSAVLSSFRFDRSGRLVFGSVGALQDIGALVHRAWAIRSLRRLFPQLDELEFETGWFGMIGMTSTTCRAFTSSTVTSSPSTAITDAGLHPAPSSAVCWRPTSSATLQKRIYHFQRRLLNIGGFVPPVRPSTEQAPNWFTSLERVSDPPSGSCISDQGEFPRWYGHFRHVAIYVNS